MTDIDEIRRANLRRLDIELGGPSVIADLAKMSPSQYTNLRDGARDSRTGKPRGMRKETARRLELAAGKAAGWLDEPHDDAVAQEAPAPAYSPASVRIPLLANLGSMGNGEPDLHEDVFIGELTVSLAWIQREVRPTSVRALRFIHGSGESMAPTFASGDVLLVDTGARNPDANGGIYALRVDDDVFIKRVRRRMDGQFEVSSDNPAIKTVDVLDGRRQLDVPGRVICAWNWHRL